MNTLTGTGVGRVVGCSHAASAVLGVAIVFAFGLAAEGRAQGGPLPYLGPEFIGQWSGPWQLGDQINPVPGEWGEIVHMTTLGPPNEGQILFWCRRATTASPAVTQATFLWDKATPDSLMAVDVGNPVDGSEDIFCAGHTFTVDGDLFVVGGTDFPASIAQSAPIGTRGAYLFDNSSSTWVKLSDMDEVRYYPSAVRVDTGDILVGGDSGSTGNDNTRETADVDGSLLQVTWDPGTAAPINYREIGCLPPGPSDEYELDDYPRWNFLISGLKRQLLRTYTAHSFLEFDSCPGSAVTDRFIEISSPSTPASGGGNTAHFIYPDPNPALGSHEVVYALGGSIYGETCSQLVSNEVLTLTDLDPNTDWVDGGIGMNRRRIDHNSVILLDGSILVVNGYGPA